MFYLQTLLAVVAFTCALLLVATRAVKSLFIGVLGGIALWVVMLPLTWLVNGAYS
jgi:hypothetical protein